MGIKTIQGKFTKVYLKKCRGLKLGCIHQFFTQQPNKLYCSAWCRHESILESNRRSRAKILKNPDAKKRKHSKKNGTVDDKQQLSPISIIGYISPQLTNYNDARFYLVGLSISKLKKETFHYPIIKKGKQNNKSTADESGASSSLLSQYQYVTPDDLYALSIAYLRDTGVKCPECGNIQNLVERAYLICSNPKCGLVLKAPIIHPGFTLYDLTPIKKVAPTEQDFPPIDFTKKSKKRQPKAFGAIKEAHNKAYSNYQREAPVFDVDTHKYTTNDPMNPEYWQYYKENKIYSKC